MKTLLARIRSSGRDQKHILIIGWGDRSKYLVNQIENHREFGLVVKNIIDPENVLKIESHQGVPVIPTMDDFTNIVLSNAIDEVFFTISLKKIPNIEECLTFLNSCGVNYHVMVDISAFTINNNELRIKPELKYFYGVPTVSYHAIPADLYRLYVKNFCERCFAIVILLMAMPLLIISGLGIWISSRGGILFKQKRIGLHGRKFDAIKLRTMNLNAENEKLSLDQLNEQSGPVFKMEKDPRVTSIGRVLRKFSIDEIPQLWNVIRGEMNLIGPRPLPVEEINNIYKSYHLRRHSMKPGLTGLWQINGRNDIQDFEDWIKLDLEYIDNWSLWRDVKIALRTIPVILKGTGR